MNRDPNFFQVPEIYNEIAIIIILTLSFDSPFFLSLIFITVFAFTYTLSCVIRAEKINLAASFSWSAENRHFRAKRLLNTDCFMLILFFSVVNIVMYARHEKRLSDGWGISAITGLATNDCRGKS